ncbi:MAG: hypothetical protein Q8918_19135 [Bacteroidota bacterium]|nr:hypothetical protein [Bacteroidota bacterium]MDP4252220.1 hypothetical protein [Bacteroidota bacterium]
MKKHLVAITKQQFTPGSIRLTILNSQLHKAVTSNLLVTSLLVPEASVPVLKRAIREVVLITPGLLGQPTLLPAINIFKKLLLIGRHKLFLIEAKCSKLNQKDGLLGGLR